MSGKKVLERSELAVWPCVWSVCVRACVCACVCVCVRVCVSLSGFDRMCQADPSAFVSIYRLNSLTFVCVFVSYFHLLFPSGEQNQCVPVCQYDIASQASIFQQN